jgi:hypothetical protein
MEKNDANQGLIMLERFQLSRKNMADVLHAIIQSKADEVQTILKKAWSLDGENAFVMPEIFEKVIKSCQKGPIGLSINEIVMLGNHIEFTHLSSSAVQNWIKRDMRELIGSPQHGKKYTVEQAAILLIVEDLKASLDFLSIRKILHLIFNNPADRSDDLIDPVHFYAAYAGIFEKLHHEHIPFNLEMVPIHQKINQFIGNEAELLISQFTFLKDKEKEIVQTMMITAVNTVISAYYQHTTKINLNKMLSS